MRGIYKIWKPTSLVRAQITLQIYAVNDAGRANPKNRIARKKRPIGRGRRFPLPLESL